jgi:hypothetical protein
MEVRDMSIGNDLEKLWETYVSQNWDTCAQISARTMMYDGLEFVMVYNPMRDSYESTKQHNAEKTKLDRSSCLLCPENIGDEASIDYGGLTIYINSRPTLKGHLLINTPAHSASPTAECHSSAIMLANETDYLVFQNLKNSGAGIPNHFHYQAQLRENFPLADLADSGTLDLHAISSNPNYTVLVPTTSQQYDDVTQLYGNASAHTSRHIPNYGALITLADLSERTISEVSHDLLDMHAAILRQETGPAISYNLLFDRKNIWIFPRTHEKLDLSALPLESEETGKRLIESGLKDWQIGGQEMGHLFTARTRGILDNMTSDILGYALESVTISDKSGRSQFENLLIEISRRER